MIQTVYTHQISVRSGKSIRDVQTVYIFFTFFMRLRHTGQVPAASAILQWAIQQINARINAMFVLHTTYMHQRWICGFVFEKKSTLFRIRNRTSSVRMGGRNSPLVHQSKLHRDDVYHSAHCLLLAFRQVYCCSLDLQHPHLLEKENSKRNPNLSCHHVCLKA